MRGILTYHSIDESGSPISVPEATFRSHVRFLASGAVSVVPLTRIADMPVDADAVALTFDDGFANFSSTALPLLRDHQLAATVFVVSEHAGRRNDWGGRAAPGIPVLDLMSWSEIGAAADAGIEIGAHTRTHPDLTTVSAQAMEDEIRGASDRIETELGRRPTSFAYPYGAVNEAAATLAGDAFERSCTTEFRPVSADEVRHRLPRLDAWYFGAPGQLEAWGAPAFRRRLWMRRQARRVRRLIVPRP
jgi:peptidoglycan/xylan/chitin deacetylase (PgdA/CDA1 family)